MQVQGRPLMKSRMQGCDYCCAVDVDVDRRWFVVASSLAWRWREGVVLRCVGVRALRCCAALSCVVVVVAAVGMRFVGVARVASVVECGGVQRTTNHVNDDDDTMSVVVLLCSTQTTAIVR